MRKDAKRDAFRYQSRVLTGLEAVSNALQIGSDLPGEHLVIAGAEHIWSSAAVGDGLKRDGCGPLVKVSACGHKIVRAEGDEVESLPEDEHVVRKISGAARGGHVVATGAGVGIRAGDAIVIPGKGERAVGIGESCSGAFG